MYDFIEIFSFKFFYLFSFLVFVFEITKKFSDEVLQVNLRNMCSENRYKDKKRREKEAVGPDFQNDPLIDQFHQHQLQSTPNSNNVNQNRKESKKNNFSNSQICITKENKENNSSESIDENFEDTAFVNHYINSQFQKTLLQINSANNILYENI